MTYDVARGKTVLFGGLLADSLFGDTATVNGNDTWEWDGATWQQRISPTAPTARNRAGLAYDRNRNRVVLHAGVPFGNSVSGGVFDDTWEWDGASWLQRAVPYTPYQGEAPMAYHATTRQIVHSFIETATLGLGSDRATETCLYGHDADGDGLLGCADPDCAAYCDPLCDAYGTCTGSRPRCGDGTCSSLESKRLCPADCGAPIAVCGDYLCDAIESAATCPGDCW
jgi:hypothetical protein